MVPFDPLIALLVNALHEAAKTRKHRHVKYKTQMMALRGLSMTCREARDQRRQQPAASPLLCYFLHLFGAYNIFTRRGDTEYPSLRFFDGIPSDLIVTAADCLPPNDHPELVTIENADRFLNVQNLLSWRVNFAESLSEGECVYHKMTLREFADLWPFFYTTENLPANLPRVIYRFFGFVRHLLHLQSRARLLRIASSGIGYTAGHMVTRPDKECSRNGCHRQASWPKMPRALPIFASMSYWNQCEWNDDGDRPGRSYNLCIHELRNWSAFFAENKLVFCCGACENQTLDEFSRLVQGRLFGDNQDRSDLLSATEFVNLPRTCRGGRGGYGGGSSSNASFSQGRRLLTAASLQNGIGSRRLFKAALERNALVRRNLRPLEAHEPRHLPFSHEDVAQLRRQLTRALNIDTALLLAATILQELPEIQRPNKALPRALDWRNSASHSTMFYFKAILTLHGLYKETYEGQGASASDPHIQTTEAADSRFLQKVKSNVLNVF